MTTPSSINDLISSFKEMVFMRDENHRLIEDLLVNRLREEAKLVRRLDRQVDFLKQSAQPLSKKSGINDSSACVHCSKCHNRQSRSSSKMSSSKLSTKLGLPLHSISSYGQSSVSESPMKYPSDKIQSVSSLDSLEWRLQNLNDKLDSVSRKTDGITSRSRLLVTNSERLNSKISSLQNELSRIQDEDF